MGLAARSISVTYTPVATLIAILLSGVSAGTASPQSPAPSAHLGSVESRIVQRELVPLNAASQPLDVILTSSTRPASAGEQPQLELEVRRHQSSLYSFRTHHPEMSVDGFALRDLDGDGFAEIVMWTSDVLGGKQRQCAQVLREVNGELREGPAHELCRKAGPRASLRWVESSRGSLAVLAQPSSKNTAECTQYQGSLCRFEYSVYGWSRERGTFELRRRLESRQAYDAHEDPLERDLAFVSAELGAHDALDELAELAGPGAPPPNEGDSDPACKATKWLLLHRLNTSLEPGSRRVRISLLRSCERTGWTGMREPHYDVDLVVTDRGKVRYRFWRPHAFGADDEAYAFGWQFSLRDVTGDGTAEVLFRSGFAAVSSFIRREHVLYARGNGGPVVDVSVPDFAHMWENPFAWVDHDGVAVAIKAQRTHPAHPESTCHSCAYFAEFRVWRWDQTKEAFALQRSLKSLAAYAEESAIDAELDRLLQKLSSPRSRGQD